MTLTCFVFNVFDYLNKRRCLNKILGMKKGKVWTTISIFKRYLKEDYMYQLITYDDFKAYCQLNDLCSMLKLHLIPSMEQIDLKNEIHFGGPITNVRVDNYLGEYFPKFQYFTKPGGGTPKNIYNQRSSIKTHNDDRAYRIGNIYLNIDHGMDYIFLIKLIISPSNIKMKKTIHLMFAAHSTGSSKIIECLKVHSKEIYKKVKKNRYFLVIPINREHNTLEFDKMLDCTLEMF